MQEGMRQALRDFGAKAEVAVMVEKKVSYHNSSKSTSNGGSTSDGEYSLVKRKSQY